MDNRISNFRISITRDGYTNFIDYITIKILLWRLIEASIMSFPFGHRRVQNISGSSYVNLPRPWALANKLQEGGKVMVDLLEDGSLKITPVQEGEP